MEEKTEKGGLTFRLLRSEDVEDLFLFAEEYNWRLSPAEIKVWVNNKHFRNKFLILEKDNVFIGLAYAFWYGKVLYIGVFGIKIEFQDQGFDKILWDELMKRNDVIGKEVNIALAPIENFDTGFLLPKTSNYLKKPFVKVLKGKFNVQNANELIQIRLTKPKDVKTTQDQAENYLRCWELDNQTISLVARRNAPLVGHLVASKYTKQVYRVGPLQAETLEVAKALLRELVAILPKNTYFTADIDTTQDVRIEDFFDEKTIEGKEEGFYLLPNGYESFVFPSARHNIMWFHNSPYMYPTQLLNDTFWNSEDHPFQSI